MGGENGRYMQSNVLSQTTMEVDFLNAPAGGSVPKTNKESIASLVNASCDDLVKVQANEEADRAESFGRVTRGSSGGTGISQVLGKKSWKKRARGGQMTSTE